MSTYVDYAKLKERVSIDQIVTHYGWKLQKKSDQLVGDCPVCGNDNIESTRFKVTPAKGAWKCFGDCKKGGNMIDLVAEVEGIKLTEAARRIAEWFKVTDCELERSSKKQTAKGKDDAGESREPEVGESDPKPEPSRVHSLGFENAFSYDITVMSFREACIRIKHGELNPEHLRIIDISKLQETFVDDSIDDIASVYAGS